MRESPAVRQVELEQQAPKSGETLTVWRKVQQLEIAAAAVRKPHWHAVEVVAPKRGCAVALILKGKRFLSVEASLLPMPDCARPATCSCVYKKHADRRAGPRREEEDTGIRRFSTLDQDRRVTRGRRKSDYS